jgi:hypothetical protein
MNEINRKGPIEKLTRYCTECKYYTKKLTFDNYHGQVKAGYCNELNTYLDYVTHNITPDECPYEPEEKLVDDVVNIISKIEDKMPVVKSYIEMFIKNRNLISFNKMMEVFYDDLKDDNNFLKKVKTLTKHISKKYISSNSLNLLK